MRALCPDCGFHHEVVRVFDEAMEERRDVYQVAPLNGCERAWIDDKELLNARARFHQDALVADDAEGELE